MSYILDALRKAEDERSGTVAPLRARGPEPRPGRRRLPWMVAGISLALLPLTAWLAFRDPAAPPPAVSGPASGAAAPAVRPLPARPQPDAPPPAISSVAPPSARETARPVPAPRQAPPAPAPPRRDRDPSPGAVATESVAPPPLPPDAPHAVATAPAPPPPAAAAAPPVQPRTVPPAAAPAGPAPSAQDAMAQLSLTVLVHTADARDRLVYIDGKRYAEGERVEGRYLVEAIHPDGVRLSFEGERYFLRAGLGPSAR